MGRVQSPSSSSSSSLSFSFLACLLVASLAFVYGQEIGLPGGSEDILTNPYVDSFSCEGQAYGYYADVDNACEIFHICLPIQDNEGNIESYAKWSFACPNVTVFDQSTLTCNHPQDAFPCEESPSLYGAVEFGAVEE